MKKYTYLIETPISSIPKGTLVKLGLERYAKFKRFYLPEPETFEYFQDWVFVEFEGMDRPVIQHRTYHPTLATLMDSVGPYARDSSFLKMETKMECIMTFEVENEYNLPLCCRDACGRLKKPLSVEEIS
jgi:hypothetical protein